MAATGLNGFLWKGSEDRGDPYALGALHGVMDDLTLPIKERHTALYNAGMRAGNFIGALRLNETFAVESLVAVARKLKYQERDARRHIEAGVRMGRQNPQWQCDDPDPGTIVDKVHAREVNLLWFVETFADLAVRIPTMLNGPTVFKLLSAAALHSWKGGRVEWPWSTRQFGEAGGMANSGPSRYLPHLRPYLRQRDRGSRLFSEAMTLRLNRGWVKARTSRDPDERKCNTDLQSGGPALYVLQNRPSFPHPAFVHPSTVPALDPSLNIWNRDATGYHTYALAVATGEDGMTLAELCAWSPRKRPTLRKALKRLLKMGLVTEVEGVYYANTHVMPVYDGVDHAARRRQRHECERIRHRAWAAAMFEEIMRKREEIARRREEARAEPPDPEPPGEHRRVDLHESAPPGVNHRAARRDPVLLRT